MPIFLHQPKFLLSAMIFVAVLMVGVRLGDMWISVTEGKPFHAVTSSQAADVPPEQEKIFANK